MTPCLVRFTSGSFHLRVREDTGEQVFDKPFPADTEVYSTGTVHISIKIGTIKKNETGSVPPSYASQKIISFP